MQITNEMVAEACFVYQQQGNMRAALEAALGERKLNDDIVSSLRVRADLRDGHMGYETLTGIACRDAAACIEELAAALKPFTHKFASDEALNEREDDEPYLYLRPICVGDLRRARATIERWGLK